MSDLCVADGASAWFGGYARGSNADCDEAMAMLAISGVVLAILYTGCGLYHTHLALKYSAGSMCFLVAAGLVSVIAYSTQAAVYWNPLYNINGGPSHVIAGALFLQQHASLLVGIYVFWVLDRAARYSKIQARLWAGSWLIGLLIVFGYVVQAVAIAMVTAPGNSDRSSGLSDDGSGLVGERIWTATLAAQAIAQLLLTANAVEIYRSTSTSTSTSTSRATSSVRAAGKAREAREMRLFLITVVAALVLLFERTIFRAATTVFAANHAYDILTEDGAYPGAKLSPEGEGSTYTTIAWLNFGLDGLPLLLALAVLALMPVARIVPTTLTTLAGMTSTPAYHYRPTVRVGATFDAARASAVREAREAMNQNTHTETPVPQTVQTVPTIELREQAIVAGEQPNLREMPPAYEAAPAYEPVEPVEGAGVVEEARSAV